MASMRHFPGLPSVWTPGQDVSPSVTFFDDFVVGGSSAGWGAADVAHWLLTETGTGTEVIGDDEPGGVLHITNGTSDNDSHEFQLNGESFKVAAGKDMIFQARLKLTAAVAPLTTIDWFIGLAETDTAVLDGTTERIGFGSNGANAGAADIYAWNEDASTETSTDTTVDYVDDTFFVVTAHVRSNTSIAFYVDGTLRATHTTNIPSTDAITPTIVVQNNAAAAKQMLVDYVYVAQAR